MIPLLYKRVLRKACQTSKLLTVNSSMNAELVLTSFHQRQFQEASREEPLQHCMSKVSEAITLSLQSGRLLYHSSISFPAIIKGTEQECSNWSSALSTPSTQHPGTETWGPPLPPATVLYLSRDKAGWLQSQWSNRTCWDARTAQHNLTVYSVPSGLLC